MKIITKKTVLINNIKNIIKLMYNEETNSYKVTAAKKNNVYLTAGGMNKETAINTYKEF